MSNNSLYLASSSYNDMMKMKMKSLGPVYLVKSQITVYLASSS